jgi:hypothetical protein
MVTTEATASSLEVNSKFIETTGSIKLAVVERGRAFLRSLVQRRQCLSPRDDVERALQRDRKSLERLAVDDQRDVYTELLEHVFTEYHGQRWRRQL